MHIYVHVHTMGKLTLITHALINLVSGLAPITAQGRLTLIILVIKALGRLLITLVLGRATLTTLGRVALTIWLGRAALITLGRAALTTQLGRAALTTLDRQV